MYVLAVTGGIGSGKSTAARFFGERGALVLDLDDLAKGLIAKGGPLVDDVVERFGPGVATSDGAIDTAALAATAFSSREGARALDEVMHPGVLAATEGALDMLEVQARPPAVVVVDIPLLVEAPDFFALMDGVLVISADEDARLERATAAGLTEDDARRRMDLQASDSERREIASWVIENDGSPEDYRRALQAFWETEMVPRVGSSEATDSPQHP